MKLPTLPRPATDPECRFPVARAVRIGDGGSAIVEFCFLAIVLMIPLAYAVLAVFRVQSTAYAISAATREAGRAFTTGSPASRVSPEDAARISLADFGLSLGPGELQVDCGDGSCATPGSSVRFAITRRVPLPFLPTGRGGHVLAAITVTGQHVAVIDRFRPE